MYDVHYLCRASYDSGYSCPPRVSSVFCNCVKLSVVLTMSLSFRSNVNYIPPPQEVSSFFFVVFLCFFCLGNFSGKPWYSHHFGYTILTQYRLSICFFISPRILNTPSHLCSEKLAFHQESIAWGTRCQHWTFFFLEVNSWASKSCKFQSSSSNNPFGRVTTRQNFARLLLTRFAVWVCLCHWRFLLLRDLVVSWDSAPLWWSDVILLNELWSRVQQRFLHTLLLPFAGQSF